MDKLPVEMIDMIFADMSPLDKANFCRINKAFHGYCKQRKYDAPSWRVLKKKLNWIEKPGKIFGNRGRWVNPDSYKNKSSAWLKSRKKVALLQNVHEQGVKYYYDANGNIFDYKYFSGVRYHAKQALDYKTLDESNEFQPDIYKYLPTATFGKMLKRIYAKKYAENRKLHKYAES